jgi:hypothetical protein
MTLTFSLETVMLQLVWRQICAGTLTHFGPPTRLTQALDSIKLYPFFSTPKSIHA